MPQISARAQPWKMGAVLENGVSVTFPPGKPHAAAWRTTGRCCSLLCRSPSPWWTRARSSACSISPLNRSPPNGQPRLTVSRISLNRRTRSHNLKKHSAQDVFPIAVLHTLRSTNTARCRFYGSRQRNVEFAIRNAPAIARARACHGSRPAASAPLPVAGCICSAPDRRGFRRRRAPC